MLTRPFWFLSAGAGSAFRGGGQQGGAGADAGAGAGVGAGAGAALAPSVPAEPRPAGLGGRAAAAGSVHSLQASDVQATPNNLVMAAV